MRVVLPASDVPSGSIVTKRTGQKEMTLHRSITIYNENKTSQTIDAAPGSVFLIDDRGTINAISGSTEILWSVSEKTLFNYLEEFLEGPHR